MLILVVQILTEAREEEAKKYLAEIEAVVS